MEIKPCPFCGIHVSLKKDNDLMAHYVEHPSNPIHGPKCPLGSFGTFLAQWNRRAEPAGLRKGIQHAINRLVEFCETNYDSETYNPRESFLRDIISHLEGTLIEDEAALANTKPSVPEDQQLAILRRIIERGLSAAQRDQASQYVDLFQHLLDELQRVEPSVPVSRSTYWLIERASDPRVPVTIFWNKARWLSIESSGQPMECIANECWTNNPQKALRFCRKEDAQAMLSLWSRDMTPYFVTEHEDVITEARNHE